MRVLSALLLLTVCVSARAADWTWMEEAAKESPERLAREVHDFDTVQRGLAEVKVEALREAMARPDGAEDAARLRQEMAAQVALVKEAYEKALGMQPDNAALVNYHGEFLYDALGEEAAGVAAWERAVALDDKLDLAHNNLGIHYFHGGEYAKGLEHLDRALKLDGKHPDFLYNMAQMYLIHTPQVAELRGWKEAKVYREAMDLSRKAAELSPQDYDLNKDYALNFFSAERFGVKVDWEEAAAAWARARACATGKAETFNAWINEGRAWLAAGEDARAVPCLEQALAIDPDSGAAANLLEGARVRAEENAAR